MQPISAFISPFTLDGIPREVIERSNRAAVEYRERAERQEREKLLERSQIPREYWGATLDGMPMLQEFAAQFGALKRQRPSGNVLLLGVAGCGKTYAACAVGMDVLSRCHSVRFVTAPGYVAELQEAFDGRASRADVFSKYAECRLLILDDFGKGKPTDWSTGEFWRLIDKRKNDMRPTVITTQYDERGLTERLAVGSDRESAEAIVSRIFDRRSWIPQVPGLFDRRRHG